MKNDMIQWPRAQYWDKAWNPIIGCKPCSPACANCYAAAWAERFGQSFEPHATKQKPPRKGVVFCGNMTDLFGDWVPHPGMLVASARTVQGYPSAKDPVYLWLTKRVDRMCDAIAKLDLAGFEDQHYFGFTAENQKWYDERHLNVLGKPDGFPMWTKWWVSCEPLLGPIHLWMPPSFRAPSWVVVGCESGPNRRPCKIEWVESIVDQCRSAGTPVFVKQLDLNGKCERDITKFPAHLRIRQVPWATEGASK